MVLQVRPTPQATVNYMRKPSYVGYLGVTDHRRQVKEGGGGGGGGGRKARKGGREGGREGEREGGLIDIAMYIFNLHLQHTAKLLSESTPISHSPAHIA